MGVFNNRGMGLFDISQEPKLEVPTIYKAYFKGYAPQNMAFYIWY